MNALVVRRLPVLNRDKRLVGILSLGDIAKSADRIGVTRALGDIAQSSGQHNQIR